MIEKLDESRDETTATARDWVLRLASGEPSAAELRRLRTWLAEAPAHREAFETERSFWHRLGRLQQASAADAEGAAGQGRAVPAPRGAFGRRTALAAGALAACLALFAVTGDLGTTLRADHSTAVGAQASVTLPDGSIAHLNTDSALDVDYTAGERHIGLLRGEALFEVAADRSRPFRVEAAGGETRALGTVFAVRLDEDRATVTVTEGRVEVTSPAGAEDPRSRVQAARGERTGYRRDRPPRAVEPVELSTVALWRRGTIRIDGLPLEEALAELDRYRPGRILLLGDRAAYGPVSGAFDLDNLDAAIAGLAATHGLRVTKLTDYLLILR